EIYFANNNARRCNSNDYAKNNGAYVADNGYSRWWIRSPNPKYSSYVYGVDPEGVVFCDVFFSNLFGVAYDYVAVRPALWINC
ncbi:hypothetical protein IJJ97_05970, partial [bacterium]|nr:hypothetical protein [bacterium]